MELAQLLPSGLIPGEVVGSAPAVRIEKGKMYSDQ